MSLYDDKNSCSEMCEGLWVAYDKHPVTKVDKPSEGDKYFLWEGLKKVGGQVISNSPYKADTLIIIHTITIAPCDFQEEGLTPSVMEWASVAFNFISPQVKVSFNKALNKYKFCY